MVTLSKLRSSARPQTEAGTANKRVHHLLGTNVAKPNSEGRSGWEWHFGLRRIAVAAPDRSLFWWQKRNRETGLRFCSRGFCPCWVGRTFAGPASGLWKRRTDFVQGLRSCISPRELIATAFANLRGLGLVFFYCDRASDLGAAFEERAKRREKSCSLDRFDEMPDVVGFP